MPSTVQSSSVVDFYKDAKILITGGTGFLGKALLEKLLRACKNVNHIYLLVRIKKGKDPESRVRELFQDPLFETVRKECPDFEKKVSCIPGEMTLPGMNMSEEDYNFLTKEVTHVFHSAATVRFQEKLASALAINVFGTHEILMFSKKCTNLKVLVHVSTAFAYCTREYVDEEHYDPPMSGEAALTLKSIVDEEHLNSISDKLIPPWPNTYSYTKAIAEGLVREHAKNLPAVIFRPAIIMGTYDEPVSGWIDNIYGPTGIVAAAGAGLLRVLHADKTKPANLIPVDFTVNAMICCAWETGNRYLARKTNEDLAKEDIKHKQSDIKIFNFAPKEDNLLTWGEFSKKNLYYGLEIPTSNTIWYYSVTFTTVRLFYNIMIFFLHLIPAVLGDLILVSMGKKAQFWKAYKKIHVFLEAMEVFSLHGWTFSNTNIRNLWNSLSETDKKLFGFDMSVVDWDVYFRSVILGIRKYIFHDSMDTLPAAKRKMFYFWVAHRTLQFSLILILLWILSKFLFGASDFFYPPIEATLMSKPDIIRNIS